MGLPRTVASFTALLIFAYPTPGGSMPIPHFDKMSMEAQSEFIATMVDVTERTLRETGNSVAADRMVPLFADIHPGDTMSWGLIALEENIDRARVVDLEHVQKDPNASRVEVERALFLTLKKAEIDIPVQTANGIISVLTNFHPMTYAEFQSIPTADQRRYLVRMAQLGIPHYDLTDRLDKVSRKASTLDPKAYKENLQLQNDVIRKYFPAGTDIQPGFIALAPKIRSEGASHPNQPGPFYELLIYILKQTDAALQNEMREMENKTYHLPDRPKR